MRRPRRPLLALAALLALALAPACPEVFVDPPLPPERIGPVGVVALAGADLVVLEGARTALAGRASRALGGDPALAWAQTAGPPVLLTNAASPLPAFVAPFAPATLVFELRASAGGAEAVDTVTVEVVTVDEAGAGPERRPAGFLEVPADAIAAPGEALSFRVDAVGGVVQPASVTARLACEPGGDVSVARVEGAGASHDVLVTLPATLPCIVVVEGTDALGRGLAPAARIFWPEGTPLPAATRMPGRLLAAPGAPAPLSLGGGDAVGRLWAAGGDGDVLPGGALDVAEVDVALPRREAQHAFAGETLLGGASGGVQYTFVDVDDGAGNIAPTAHGGPDRVVAPGARFRLDSAGSFDLDGDPLTITAAQVLGATAVPDALIAGAFEAPATPGELLFHVVADDGTVLSAIDPVRVVVEEGAENVAPVLALPATRYAVPGEVFVVDGRGAEDPDSGFVALVTIAQAEDDDVVLLPEPVERAAADAHIELTAGAAGETYRFLISAYDEEGLGVTVEQTVIVEEAGPYVDRARGDDATGNGTALSPFATVAGALATVVRHAFPEMLLAAGDHAPLGVVLPRRVSLRGGVVFDGAAYVDDAAAETRLPVNGAGLGVVDGHLESLTLALQTATASVTLEGASTLARARVTATPAHAAPLVVIRSLAAARVLQSELVPAAEEGPEGLAGAASVVVEAGAVARLQQVVLQGGDGADAVGVLCAGATLSIDASTLTGAASPDGALGAAAGTGIRARDDCALDVTGSRVEGGAATTAIGVDAADTLLLADAASVFVGATHDAAPGDATAVRFTGLARSALLEASLVAADEVTVENATGLSCEDAAVTLVGARVTAFGTVGVAVAPRACALVTEGAQLEGASAALRGGPAEEVTLSGGSLTGGEAGLDLTGEARRTLTGVLVTAGAIGVRVEGAVELDDVDVVVTGADEPVGVEARGATLRGARVDVSGGAARGLVLGDAASTIERSVVVTNASTATAVAHAGPLAILSSIIRASATAVESAGPLTLRHGTLVAGDGAAVLASAALDAANTVFVGPVDVGAAPPWTQAVALAFAGALIADGQPVTTEAGLEDLGCDACLIVDASVIDEAGRLAPGDNPLVDAGDEGLSHPFDVDGEARPQGEGPDIGADERVE